MRRLIFIAPLGLFIGIMVYLSAPLQPGYDSTLLPSVMIGKLAPKFDLPGPPRSRAYTGSPIKFDVSTKDLLGHVSVINFFASWCAPCRVEAPVLMGLGSTAGVPVIGIAYKDQPNAVIGFLDRYGDPYSSIGIDERGRTGIDFGVYGVPETYVVDKHGIIRMRYVGPLTAEVVADKILPLLRHLEVQSG
jgi:cytochrome c biogenesis protein CcmG, thiol:disulfide interchange protein DsbE